MATIDDHSCNCGRCSLFTGQLLVSPTEDVELLMPPAGRFVPLRPALRLPGGVTLVVDHEGRHDLAARWWGVLSAQAMYLSVWHGAAPGGRSGRGV